MDFKKELVTLLKARNTLIVVQSSEEPRAISIIEDAAYSAKYPVRRWDCWKGITDSEGNVVNNQTLPERALRYVEDTKERYLYIFKDLDGWFDPVIRRGLKSIALDLQKAPPKEARVVVLLNPPMKVPTDLSIATVMDLPLPDRDEMGKLLDDVMKAAPESVAKMNGEREKAIESAMGLMHHKAGDVFARSIVTEKAIDPKIILSEKKRVIAESGLVTIYEPDPRGLGAVGGNDLLKVWLNVRREAFSERAREFGLPAPKGVIIVGVSGCGKSLTAKCTAASWVVPLLRFDVGAVLSKYVGESGLNVRQVYKIAEAAAPCVLWVDELEKALAGSSGPQGDGGVSSDILGSILTWMQEKTAPVFVIATANDVSALPPELLRKGRFDDMFFVDLPNKVERKAIVEVTLQQYKRSADNIDVELIAGKTEGFTGAEIATLIPEALFTAFNDGERDLTTEDIMLAAETVVPLKETAGDKIEELRKWAKGRARLASTPDTESESSVSRVLEID